MYLGIEEIDREPVFRESDWWHEETKKYVRRKTADWSCLKHRTDGGLIVVVLEDEGENVPKDHGKHQCKSCGKVFYIPF